MPVSVKSFARDESTPLDRRAGAVPVESNLRRSFVWFQLLLGYILIEKALWAAGHDTRNHWAMVAAVWVVFCVIVDHPSLYRLGLSLPGTLGLTLVLATSFATAGALLFAVHWAGGQIPANPTWPSLHTAWQYLIWALMQEFILQSFFFTRCEDLFGSSAGVWIAATLFSAVHLPSPLLTTFTLIGGLLFCEMFRRVRSIYPIAVLHAVLGLTVALTMPDSVLHHMRVGIGYLRY